MSTDLRKLLIFSLAVTAALWLAIASERSQIEDPLRTSIFHHLLVHQDYDAAPLFFAILLAALFKPIQRAALALARWCDGHILAVAAASAGFLALGARLAYHAYPLSMDEYAPLFQSGAFAAGRIAGEFPPDLLPWLIPRNFVNVFFRADPAGHVISTYWPGFALLLTPFTALKVPWLLNPLIGGATVLVMHRLARELLGRPEAVGLVVLATLASPAVTINAVSYYSMPVHLLANATFALLLLRATARRALIAGFVGSIALVLHNPVPHMVFALPWIVWVALQANRIQLLAALTAGYLPVCLLIGFGWAWYQRGFGSSPTDVAAQIGAGQMMLRAAGNVLELPSHLLLMDRLWALGKIWLWAAPALVALALAGGWESRHKGLWRVLMASAILTLVVYCFVPFDQGHGWGYRYFHSAWLVIPLLAAAANSRLHGYVAACAVLSLVLLNGLRAHQVDSFIREHVAQIPIAPSGTPRVTIIEPLGGYYAADAVQNDPFLRRPTMLLVTRGHSRDAVMMARRFPDYRLLHMDRRGSVWGTP
jgi:hypothetical protein